MNLPSHHRSAQSVISTGTAISGAAGLSICGATATIFSDGVRMAFIPVQRAPVFQVHAAVKREDHANLEKRAEMRVRIRKSRSKCSGVRKMSRHNNSNTNHIHQP